MFLVYVLKISRYTQVDHTEAGRAGGGSDVDGGFVSSVVRDSQFRLEEEVCGCGHASVATAAVIGCLAGMQEKVLEARLERSSQREVF
jgi:hypothetical protein